MSTANSLVVFDALKAQVAIFAKDLTKITVYSRDSQDNALVALKEAARLEKSVDHLRKQYVKPLNDQVKAANAYADSITEGLEKGIHALKTQLASWERKLMAEREEERRQADVERREREEALLAARAKEVAAEPREMTWDDFAAPALEPHEAELAEQTRLAALEREEIEIAAAHAAKERELNEKRVKGARKVWKFEIEFCHEVPRDYCSVDERKIRQAVQNGERNIPGVRIYEDVVIAAGRA